MLSVIHIQFNHLSSYNSIVNVIANCVMFDGQLAYYPINNEMLNKIFLKCSIYVNVMIQIDSTTRIKLIYDNEYPFKAHFIAIM